uniref:Uncharacterized protein n=1 Tax=Arundo donax TaxID=35708 RepID=A0A0A9DUI6_ARUDO
MAATPAPMQQHAARRWPQLLLSSSVPLSSIATGSDTNCWNTHTQTQ